MKKLTLTMIKTLRMIAANGGSIHSLGGGYWGSHDKSKKFLIWGAKIHLVSINKRTIQGLENRGLLQRLRIKGRRFNDSRVLTITGRQILMEYQSDIMAAGYSIQNPAT